MGAVLQLTEVLCRPTGLWGAPRGVWKGVLRFLDAAGPSALGLDRRYL
jgi:hypothetical protein